ncbi:hemin-degrading factor [Pseudoalteromonas sp. NJ631]|uniref:hemin-degrading factor n=1 Tax=Pseudoalteromonas sp. NJ631 TaxID=493915 RepID=UPI00030FDB55|nr:hemin-degrading factor [Pseudoalteromonas sp. NJ631]
MKQLIQDYKTLLAGEPRLRPVDAAMQLGVSEAELLNAQLEEAVTATVTRLDETQIADILKSLKKLGKVMALTRNGSVVNEIKGLYEKLYVSDNNGKLSGIAINPGGIDLRLFLYRWQSIFLVETESHTSFQFFDENGRAVHKVYTTTESDFNELVNIKARYQLTSQRSFSVKPFELVEPVITSPSAEQLDNFRSQWSELEDVHHFPKLLETYNFERLQALELVGSPWSFELQSFDLADIFQQAKTFKQEIMVFVGNPGAVQIFSGKVENLKQVGPWFNVLDPEFNLHIKADDLTRAFVVRKPTDNGNTVVTSIEFFDANRETVLTLFGRRIEGKKQTSEWQALCERLIHKGQAAA